MWPMNSASLLTRVFYYLEANHTTFSGGKSVTKTQALHVPAVYFL